MDMGSLGTALVLGISALGSAIGISIAGQASIGAWKKCYMSNKAAPFILTVFAGAPLTQTIYGFLLMQQMKASSADPAFLLGLGIASGVAIALSAVGQGQGRRRRRRRLGRNGQGLFAVYHGGWPVRDGGAVRAGVQHGGAGLTGTGQAEPAKPARRAGAVPGRALPLQFRHSMKTSPHGGFGPAMGAFLLLLLHGARQGRFAQGLFVMPRRVLCL